MQMFANLAPILIICETCLSRNEVRHNDTTTYADSIFRKVNNWLRELAPMIEPQNMMNEFDTIPLKVLKIDKKICEGEKPIIVLWHVPKGEEPKLNINGASKKNPGCGDVLRNKK